MTAWQRWKLARALNFAAKMLIKAGFDESVSRREVQYIYDGANDGPGTTAPGPRVGGLFAGRCPWHMLGASL